MLQDSDDETAELNPIINAGRPKSNGGILSSKRLLNELEIPIILTIPSPLMREDGDATVLTHNSSLMYNYDTR